ALEAGVEGGHGGQAGRQAVAPTKAITVDHAKMLRNTAPRICVGSFDPFMKEATGKGRASSLRLGVHCAPLFDWHRFCNGIHDTSTLGRSERMPCSMGMLQVFGTTYRIERCGDEYGIVRLLDDVAIGSFRAAGGPIVVVSSGESESLVERIARAAVRHGRTLWRPPAARRGAARSRWLPPKLAVLASSLW